MGLGVQRYIRTDSHVTTKTFEIGELLNFLRYGAPLACTSSAIKVEKQRAEKFSRVPQKGVEMDH